MKMLLVLLVSLFTTFSFSQTVSTLRMGDVKLRMSQADLSKLVGENLVIKKDIEVYLQELKVNYQGVNYDISMSEAYGDNGEDSYYQIHTISSSNPKLKTLSNIGVGSTLEDLWTAYKNNQISIYNKWDEKSESYSKTGRVFSVSDIEASTYILFNMKNNKVTSMSIVIDEGYD